MTNKQKVIIDRMWRQLTNQYHTSYIGFMKDKYENYYYLSGTMIIKTTEKYGNEASSLFDNAVTLMDADTSSYKKASLNLDELKAWKKEHKKNKYEPYIINDEIGVNIAYLIDAIEFTKSNTVFYNKPNKAMYIYGQTSSALILPIRLNRGNNI